jgi:hypothetical protein
MEELKANRQILDALFDLGVRRTARESRERRKINTAPFTIAELERAETHLYGAPNDHLEEGYRWRAVVIASRMQKYGKVQAPLPCASPMQYLNTARANLYEAHKHLRLGNYVLARAYLRDVRYQQDAYVRKSA